MAKAKVKTKREKFVENHSEFLESLIELTRKKNADYTGSSVDDPFANFTRVEATGITSTETGILVRMSDKMARITTFVNKGVLLVEDESVEDTLKDLSNYAALLACYIKQKKEDAAKK